MSEVSIANSESIKPKSVIMGVKFLYVAIIISFLRGIIVGPQIGAAEGIPFASVVLVLIFVSAIIWLLVYKISQAKNWARIVYLILFAIGNCATFWPLIVSVLEHPVSGLLGIVQAVLEIIGMVLLFSASSNQWFKLNKVASVD
ncbi:MAG: hypothetical protein NT014_05865 [Candidatus Omnitrophica bacterium]|nr:hypothetical protein [Candidatus Omnitrophota bacterium]